MLHRFSQFIRQYLLALQFFTRMPVTGRLAQWVGFSPANLRASAGHIPGLGWLVGTVVAAVTWLLLIFLPGGGFAPLAAAVWGTAVGVLLTGAFHEDGLADVMDGLGGTLERERALINMKDSQVGAVGAMAMVLVLLAKVSLLAMLGSLGGVLLCHALFAAQVVSRTWPVLLIRFMVHRGDTAGSKSKPLADQTSGSSLMTAFSWCFGALAVICCAQVAIKLIAVDRASTCLPGALAAVLAGTAVSYGLMWRWVTGRLQGFTGDCLGATQQLCELGFCPGLCRGLGAGHR